MTQPENRDAASRGESPALSEGLGLAPKRDALTLTGDQNTPPLPMTEAQVNHLRRLLAWMRCEWTLDEHMQIGYVQGAAACVAHGYATPEKAGELLTQKAEEINRCPAYVRHAVKMLTKAIRDHDSKSGVFDA